MPTITRWFVKTSLIMLGLGFVLAIYLQIPNTSSSGLFPVYLHIITVGWLTQLIFGIAIWMLPKFSTERPRGYEALNWLTYITLNLGLLLRSLFEPSSGLFPAPWREVALLLSAIFQWVAGITFATQAWIRVKGH
jgi:heme/copper-type cytochrome/quinol oxidase subunit 1